MDLAPRPPVVHEIETRRRQRLSVQREVDLKRLADKAGPVAAAGARAGLEGPNEDRLWAADRPGDEVQAMPHPIDEVDVGVPGRAIHGRRSGREATKGVGCTIFRPEVCLHLDQPAAQAPAADLANDEFAEQVPGYFERVAVEEVGSEDAFDRPSLPADAARRALWRRLSRYMFRSATTKRSSYSWSA